MAVVVDDALQNVTHIVRGADLIDSTPRQLYLQHLLDFTLTDFNKISYAHLPIATNVVGEKLSKQTLAEPINMHLAEQTLFNALVFLGQNSPNDIKNATLEQTWRWAISNRRLNNVLKTKHIVTIN